MAPAAPVPDPQRLLDQGIALHRKGRLADAQTLYQQLLAQNPRHADALHLSGLIACQRQEYASAFDLISQALSIDSGNAEYLLNLGEVERRMEHYESAAATFHRALALAPQNAFAHYNLGLTLAALSRIEEAIEHYRRALALNPLYGQAANNLGILLHQRGELAQAAELFQKALAIEPGSVESHNNLALVLWDQHQREEALAIAQSILQTSPDFVPAIVNAALFMRKLGKRQEALELLQRAARLDASSAAVQRDLAMALLEVGQVEGAIAAARQAVRLAPQSGDMHHVLGVVVAAAARSDPARFAEALAAYDEAFRLAPGNLEWQFERDGLSGTPRDTAPDSYVKTLFDAYADRFEEHLVHELHYRVPHDLLQLIVNLQSHAGIKPFPWDILDLGCGTGLCGELFRPHARQITGVDLSPNMIEIARRRRSDAPDAAIYEELLCMHILPALQRFKERFDLILAGDVFIYVGALHEIFPAAAAALRPGGLLAFSIEHHDAQTEDSDILRSGFALHRQLRFAHSPAYIRHLACQAGLSELLFRQTTLRTDVPPGWLVVLQKNAPP